MRVDRNLSARVEATVHGFITGLKTAFGPGNRVSLISYSVLVVVLIVQIYPLLWLLGSSFKPTQEIFGSVSIIPREFTVRGYIRGWLGIGNYVFGRYIYNTLLMVLPTIAGSMASSAVVAFGFARFNFRGRRLLFALMISTLMLPNTVLIVPRYLLFRMLGWLDTYWTFIVPAWTASYPFFIFLMVQFYRGLPRELDESARIDGCNSFQVLTRIIVPLSKAAILACGLFQFVWRWNDFFNVLVYINSVEKYPVALALRLTIDVGANVQWNNVIAMSVVAIVPPALMYAFTQRYFVEGVATTGLKG
jgi:oligogalacturonide transport system permease protein